MKIWGSCEGVRSWDGKGWAGSPAARKEETKPPSPTWHQRDCAQEPKLRKGHLLCLWGTSSLLFEVWTPTSDTNPLLFKESWFEEGRWVLGNSWNNFSCGRQPQMYFTLLSPEGLFWPLVPANSLQSQACVKMMSVHLNTATEWPHLLQMLPSQDLQKVSNVFLCT